MSAKCRFCCKSLFAQMITNFPSCRRGFRINMLGTSSHSDELTGDFGNEPEAISIGDHGLSRLLAEKLSPRELGLLQQNRHLTDKPTAPEFVAYWTKSGQRSLQRLNISAANDPTATLPLHCGNGFDAGFSLYQSTRLSRYNAVS